MRRKPIEKHERDILIDQWRCDLELMRSAAVSAGILALGYFKRDLNSWNKSNATPVTEADLAVDEHLAQLLNGARLHYGWLSEETKDDLVRLNKNHTFIVDPIDGTRAFMRGEDNWTISIGLVHQGRPVVGVLYAPVRDELYHAIDGDGAYMNGAPLKPLKRTNHAKPVVPAPGAVHKELAKSGKDYVHGPAISSLAYRLVQVATGRLDAAMGRRGACDWDIAAVDVILSEMGIKLHDVCTGRPSYNKVKVQHGGIVATTHMALEPHIHNAMIRVYGCPD